MTSFSNLSPLAQNVIQIAKDAGEVIMEIYQKEGFDKQIKSDNSPLTEADVCAHGLIMSRLRLLTPEVPILSEESDLISWKEREKWKEYWLIDPLDGTKEFISHNGEFTVNVALIKNHEPILGVVYAPSLEQTWIGEKGKPAQKITKGKTENIQVNLHKKGEKWKVVGSRSHAGDSLQQYLKKLGNYQFIPMGSSIKLCLVAEGKAHIYPRLGLTSEWDTAAAHAVVNAAGGQVVRYGTNDMLQYNTEDSVLNPFFIVRAC
jgi:3'(2'), 5'-bisphosphate nucleotidase